MIFFSAKKEKKPKKEKPPKETPEEKAQRLAKEKRDRELANKNAEKAQSKFDDWLDRNFSGRLVVSFPQIFMWFAFCVCFSANKAPRDFAVGLAYSNILVHATLAFSMYAKRNLLFIGSFILQAVINWLLVWHALVTDNC